MKAQKEKGITLIALVITVVILIILATVTLNVVLGEGGLIQRAQQAKDLTEQATLEEQQGLNSLMSEFTNIMAEEPGPEPIPKDEPYVGYYADVNGDGTPDGVIYADLAVSKNGQWTDGGTYSYTAITNTKDYYISQTNYEGPFETKDVLTAIDGEGEDRFYVMALEDFNTGTYYCWYDAAFGRFGNMYDYATATSLDFGTGKANTEAMIAKWNSSAYGAQNDNGTYLDMRGAIQTEIYEEGDQKGDPTWFVPSRGEWGAFGDNLQITTSNYANHGLSDVCWSSSQSGTGDAWGAIFISGFMFNINVYYNHYVRLSATF